MIPSDSTIPFKGLQFPIRLAFAMSINKSQGQTMSICGLDLENPCFSHGQLYAACSRVGKPSNLFVLAKDRQLAANWSTTTGVPMSTSSIRRRLMHLGLRKRVPL
ncbi:ATP-dependent DNA helicase [Trichonephila clavipes]|nr:ATP-dependent DNA helicase [Trichonephila clavipes]